MEIVAPKPPHFHPPKPFTNEPSKTNSFHVKWNELVQTYTYTPNPKKSQLISYVKKVMTLFFC